MKVVLCGYYGFGNLGDELILKAAIRAVKLYRPEIDLVVLSARPAETEREHGVRSVQRWSLIAVFKALFGADWFFLGGGGLIQDQTSAVSPLYYLGLSMIAKIFGVRMATYAISIESLTNPLNKALAAQVFRWFEILTVRDQESLERLLGWGISSEKVKLVSDPVFALPSLAPASQNKKVLIVPRFPSPREGELIYYGWNSSDVLYGLFQPEVEKHFLPDNFHSKVNEFPIEQMYSSARMVFSARFHGLVLAISAGVPFVGYGDVHKVGRLCELWGMPFLSWSATRADIEQALVRAEKLGPNPLKRNLTKMKELAESIPSVIFSSNLTK